MKEHLSGPGTKAERAAPDPAWVRAACPLCGAPVVSNAWYVGGKGYLIIWHCWHALGPVEEQTCTYSRVI